MKVIISERQYKFLKEQEKKFDYQTGPGTFYGTYGYDSQGKTPWTDLDPHTKNTILAMGAAFIPVVGPIISAGIGLYDAKLYWDNGEKKEAGLVALFSILPGIGGLAGKMGLGKWTSKALIEIAKKIGMGSKLSQTEIQVINRITQNRKLIETELAKLGEEGTLQAAKELAKKQIVKTTAINTAKTLGKEFGKFAVTGAAYSKGYDYVKSDDPKVKVSKEGMNWAFVKDAFGSSGSKEDNEKLNLSWDAGWRPGQIVPEKFQLQKYKHNYKQETDNLEELRKLLADIRN